MKWLTNRHQANTRLQPFQIDVIW